MDPFLVQSSHPSVLRPATALQADLAAVLREGRVLAGEVLQTLDGGALLIGIGSHRVAAHSQVEMQPGHRFLFQVDNSADAILLKVLAESSGKEHALLAALRGVLDQALPMGELLTQLALQLESAGRQAASPPAPGTQAARELLGALDSHVFDPNAGAERLRQVLQRAGFDYEAALARLALDSGPRARLETFVAELRESVLRALAAGSPAGEGFASELRQALWTEIASAFGQDDRVRLATMLDSAGLESLARDLERLFERALRSMAGARSEEHAGRIQAAVRDANLGSLVSGLRAELLRSLLGLQPPGPSSETDPGLLARLESDLKGRLLRTLEILPEGSLRDAVVRSLGGIEAEQLLNLARREGNQSQHWTLALPDGSAWTSAHLSYQRLGGRARGGYRARNRSVHRVVIAVEFSHTGAVRADLLVRSESLTARLRVSRPEVARLLRARAEQLEQGLASAGRRVHLSVEEATEADVRVERHVQDVSWLFENHVMDRFG